MIIVINILIIWFIKHETTKTPLARSCACPFLMEDKWTQTTIQGPTVEATVPTVESITLTVGTAEAVLEEESVGTNFIYPKLKFNSI